MKPSIERSLAPGDAEGCAANAGAYVVVFEQASSWLHRLPAESRARVGSEQGVEIFIPDESVSSVHAHLCTAADVARIEPIEGCVTSVNGDLLRTPRVLSSGDTILVGSTSLVFHAAPRRRAPAQMLDLAALRERAAGEVARALRTGRACSVLVIQLGNRTLADAPMQIALRELRAADFAAPDGRSLLLVLLPETPREGGIAAGRRLLLALSAVAPGSSAGFATTSSDGCDVDTLISAARAASRAARPGEVLAAGDAFDVRKIGDREAIIVDPAMVEAYELVERLAPTMVPVLVGGETGTGKELIALALHAWSLRSSGPFIAVNCAAIPEQLVESELFGHRKGAFSGAVASKEGLFEAADGGTLFLDEVGELATTVQGKILRFLETRRVRAVGDVVERAVDVRVVAATNRDLPSLVANGEFRRDLFFRLRGATIWVPPLRDRRIELPFLVRALSRQIATRIGRPALEVSPEAMRELDAYGWPGNVRELQAFLEYLTAVGRTTTVDVGQFTQWRGGDEARASGAVARPSSATAEPAVFRPIYEEIEELERARMEAALLRAEGNHTRAAELIQMPLRTFRAKAKSYHLQSRSRLRSDG